jgi:small-conductance mechanosensitive channel
MELRWEDIAFGFLSLILTILFTLALFEGFRRSDMKHFVSRHNHVFQLVLTMVFFIGLLLSVYLAFGVSMVSSLLTGLGLALGLALQPIMKKMVAGIVFDTTIQTGCKIKCGEFIGTVTQVGMVHTWIVLEENKGKACIHNDYFNTNPITILTGSSSGSLEKDPQPLKYW